MTALGKASYDAEECLTRMRVAGVRAMHEPESPRDLKLRNSDLDQIAARDFGLDGEAGHQSDAVAESDEPLDGLEAGQFDTHIERCLVAGKGFDDLLAQGRGNDVGNKILRAELANGDLLFAREGMSWVDDEGDRIGINSDGAKAFVLRPKRENSEFDGAIEQLVGDLTGQGALHVHSDVRALTTEGIENRQQPETGIFVGGDGEAAALEGAEFFESRYCFGTQAEKALGVTAEQFAGGGEGSFAGRAVKEGLADFFLEFADGVTDGRLRAVETKRSAGEALLFNDRQEGFQLREIHKRVWPCTGGT